MNLEGIHHITAITGHAQRNVDFYVGLLGLRFVKKTINFDAPEVYHLYYGDDVGNPGSILTFFEFRGAPPGHHGPGMIHTLAWRVADEGSLDFWQKRLDAEGIRVVRRDDRIAFADPEGLRVEITLDLTDEAPLIAEWRDIPKDAAIRGFEGVRVYASDPSESDSTLVDALGFLQAPGKGAYRLAGEMRSSSYVYDEAPVATGLQGAGTVHHIAWAARPGDHEAWGRRVRAAGLHPTPVIDRQYFRSIYFREPSGVLFEFATIGPGFTVDEPEEGLGESLTLPEWYEGLRPDIEKVLTPVTNPRPERRGGDRRKEDVMEQGPDERSEQTMEGVTAGNHSPAPSEAPAEPGPEEESPESLDDTAAVRPPSDS